MLVGRQASLRVEPAWGWGLDQGGMLLGPSILFGVVGLVASLLRPRRDLLPLAIAGLGMALAVLSEAQVRKLLVFDLGWQFLAAVGLFQVLYHPLLADVRRRTLLAAGGIAFVVASAWSLAAIAWTTHSTATARLDMPYMQFALPLFGDDFDSPRAFPVTKRWQDWLRQGYLVVFANTDHVANNLATYGEVAALGARRPGWFQSLHRVDPSAVAAPGILADLFGRDAPAASVVAGAARLLGAKGIMFWFERPTRWDEWLIDQIAAHGGHVHRWTPASERWGNAAAEVVVDAAVLEKGLSPLAAIDVAPDAPHDVCLALSPVRSWRLANPFVDALLPAPGGSAAWIEIGRDAVRMGAVSIPTPRRTVGAAVTGDELVTIDQAGYGCRFGLTPDLHRSTSGDQLRVAQPAGTRIGANCGARVDDDWWLVDPWRGEVLSSQPTAWLPARPPWIGLADGGDGRLILASADQHIAIVRPASRTVEALFPALVWESLKFFDAGSCAVVRRLGDHVATDLGLGNTLLALYTTAGRPVTAVRLADGLAWAASEGLSALDVSGDRLTFVRALGVPTADEYVWALEPGGTACDHGLRVLPPVKPDSPPRP